MNDTEIAAWAAVEALLAEFALRFDLSFGLEWTSANGWVADFAPRRNHPQAGAYGIWTAHHQDRATALLGAVARARRELSQSASAPLVIDRL